MHTRLNKERLRVTLIQEKTHELIRLIGLKNPKKFQKKRGNKPWRLLSSHLDCLVRMWLAHHHEYALFAALCNIISPLSLSLYTLSLSLSRTERGGQWRERERERIIGSLSLSSLLRERGEEGCGGGGGHDDVGMGASFFLLKKEEREK